MHTRTRTYIRPCMSAVWQAASQPVCLLTAIPPLPFSPPLVPPFPSLFFFPYISSTSKFPLLPCLWISLISMPSYPYRRPKPLLPPSLLPSLPPSSLLLIWPSAPFPTLSLLPRLFISLVPLHYHHSVILPPTHPANCAKQYNCTLLSDKSVGIT